MPSSAIDAFSYDWPFCGVVAAVLLVGAFAAWRRPEGAPPRLRDPVWLLGLMLPIYMLHQFEEHGIDLFGNRYAFRASFCATLGFPGGAGCPGDPIFIDAVNVGAVWIAGVSAIALRKKRPMVAACAWGVPLVNAVAHFAAFVRSGGHYNPGLLSGVILLFPVSAYVLATCVRRGVLDRSRVPVVAGCGVVLHAILIGGVLADAHGVLPHGANVVIQVLNGFLPVAIGMVVAPRAEGATPPARAAVT